MDKPFPNQNHGNYSQKGGNHSVNDINGGLRRVNPSIWIEVPWETEERLGVTQRWHPLTPGDQAVAEAVGFILARKEGRLTWILLVYSAFDLPKYD